MKTLSILTCALLLVALGAGTALALEIRVAPSTLVLSSADGRLTVHTDVPYVLADDVSLEVEGRVIGVRTFADARGYLVAQCDKADVAGVMGDFEEDTTTATVTLIVDGHVASEVIRVKK